jgi:Icc-related predicted phosphoesterase
VAIFLVSDLHGAPDALRKAVPEGGSLVLLGDLINFIDYTSMTGILTEVFPVEAVERVVALRTEGRIEEARDVMRRRSVGHEDEISQAIGTRVEEQYDKVFSVLPDPTYLILGNVDNPSVAVGLSSRTPVVRYVDGRVLELEGERFGFVGGGLPSPLHVAGEITPEQMRAKIERLGEVDVVCSHIPPALPELCFDTRAGRTERGSDDLLAYIRDVQPRRAYFGHVHQPLVSATHIGRTLCVNVGYFRATSKAFPHARWRGG